MQVFVFKILYLVPQDALLDMSLLIAVIVLLGLPERGMYANQVSEDRQ